MNLSVPETRIGRTRFQSARILLTLVAAWLAASSLVTADDGAGVFTVTPMFGGQGFPFNGESHFDCDYYYGIRAGYNFTRHWSAELLFGYNSTLHDPDRSDCHIFQYGGDVLYRFQPDKKLIPSVAAGFGGFTVDWDQTGVASESHAYFNYGGGVEYPLSHLLSLRADFRHGFFLDDLDNFMTGTVGLQFKFGSR